MTTNTNTPIDGSEYMGTPCDPQYIVVNGVPYISFNMRIADGSLKGMKFKREQKKWDARTNRYTFRDMKGAGWKGKDMGTFVADLNAAGAAGLSVKFQARQAEYNGSKWWTAERIGDSAVVKTGDAPTADTNKLMNQWLAETEQADAEWQANRGGSGPGGNDVPPPDDSDLPF
jgi:hypothetical protein